MSAVTTQVQPAIKQLRLGLSKSNRLQVKMCKKTSTRDYADAQHKLLTQAGRRQVLRQLRGFAWGNARVAMRARRVLR
jgi:hypothetical protein